MMWYKGIIVNQLIKGVSIRWRYITLVNSNEEKEKKKAAGENVPQAVGRI